MKILVAIDGSPSALCAAQHALEFVRGGLRVAFVLATVQEPTYMYETLVPDADVLERLSGTAGSRALAGAEALFEAAGVPYQREIGAGEPAATLLDLARHHECTGIFMGARGMGAIRGLLLGSVSQAVLLQAVVPVTIVKCKAEAQP